MLPDKTPLTPEQCEQLNALLNSMNEVQQAWLGGYLSASSPIVSGGGVIASPSEASLLVAYGTESGNSEALAELTVKKAKKRGIKAQLKNLAELSPVELAQHPMKTVAIIVSTWGDGEPPEALEAFYESFMKDSMDCSALRYSVCALGDSSYDKFCQTGKDFDQRLEALGAQRLVARQDCDVDFEDSYEQWVQSFLGEVSEGSRVIQDQGSASLVGGVSQGSKVYGRKEPFPAEILEKVVLNGEGSQKETIHLELSLEGSGLEYEVGDALAVYPHNKEEVVEELLTVSGLSGGETVELKGEEPMSLKEALQVHLDITALSKNVIKKYQSLTGNSELLSLLSEERKKDLKEWSWGRQIIDLIEEYPAKGITAQEFANLFRKLPLRLYSIASSFKAHPGEVHLTVGAVRYQAHGRDREGVASTYLADEVNVGDSVSVFVQPNKNFRLPEDPSKPIIMVGPGTGIAPFRAFIEERAESEKAGDSWLFFGDQHYHFDFLYQLEWQEYLKSGALTQLDVAFSRDQPEKVYVQHKLLARGEEVYRWLEQGAYFYVCGDASRMAKDVQDALLEVIQKHGERSEEEALQYLKTLKEEKRYQRDVY